MSRELYPLGDHRGHVVPDTPKRRHGTSSNFPFGSGRNIHHELQRTLHPFARSATNPAPIINSPREPLLLVSGDCKTRVCRRL